jgi:hypothetical protein
LLRGAFHRASSIFGLESMPTLTTKMRAQVADVDAARANLGLPPYGARTYRKIDIYAKMPSAGLYYLASTNWARSCKEARTALALSRPDFGYAASDLVARYA